MLLCMKLRIFGGFYRQMFSKFKEKAFSKKVVISLNLVRRSGRGADMYEGVVIILLQIDLSFPSF